MDERNSDDDLLKNYFFEDAERKKKSRRKYLTRKASEYREAAQKKRELTKANALAASVSTENDACPGPDDYGSDSTCRGSSDANATPLTDTILHPCTSNEAMINSIENYDAMLEGYSSCEQNESSDEDLTCFSAVSPNAPGTLWHDLQTAAISTNMTTTQIDAVLAALHKHRNLIGKLPKSHKSLCKATYTNVSQNIESKSGHDYYYFGVEAQLKFYLQLYPDSCINQIGTLFLTINNDGLPLFRSNSLSSWPVLVRIDNLRPKKVFPALLTVGPGKPKDLKYFEDFTSEIKDLMRNGLEFGGKTFCIMINAVVCDAPARAQVKCVKQYSSTFGCDQCESRGHHDGYRMTWPHTSDLPLRTDARFRAKSDTNHHKHGEDSPLLQLEIDMIQCFPPDFMHQGGGCMKKILSWNIFGPKTSGTGRVRCRMPIKNVEKLNKRMTQLRQFIPNCFSRKPRTFQELPYFKATELRQLQLYTAKIVFMDLMANDKIYQHLVAYNSVCALLVDERTAKPYHEFCQLLMRMFVNGCKEIYGNSFMVYNVHSHLHFPDVANAHGSLDNVSAYSFESKLGELKKMVRSSHRPIVSMIKGIQRQQAAEGNITDPPIFSSCIFTEPPNNIYINIQDQRCFQVTHKNHEKVECIEYLGISYFYDSPIDSRKIGCFQVRSNVYRYISVSAGYIRRCRRGMKIDLCKLEDMGEENQDVSICMAMLHDQESSIY